MVDQSDFNAYPTVQPRTSFGNLHRFVQVIHL